jgi:hypothetical protein
MRRRLPPRQPRRKNFLAALLLLGLLAWLIAILVSLAGEPPEGSSSPDALRSDVAAAVRERDADRLQNLFAEDTVADGYAEALLDRVDDAAPLSAALRTAGGGRLLALEAPGVCLSWSLAHRDDRWFLDGVPPLHPGRPCRG